MLRARVLALLCVLGGCATAHPSHPLWRGVVVTSITGIHEGKCGPRRAQQVSLALNSLTARDFSNWYRPASGFESLREIVANVRQLEAQHARHGVRGRIEDREIVANIRWLEAQNARHGVHGRIQNLVIIELGKSIRYPVPWGDKFSIAMHPRFVTQLIAERNPSRMGSGPTVLYFGFETPPALKRAYSGMIYEGWSLVDDPFDLGRGECGN